MSISAIDGVSPVRPAVNWSDVMTMRDSASDPIQQVASMMQKVIMDILMNLLAASKQNQSGNPSQGAMGGGGGGHGGFGGAGGAGGLGGLDAPPSNPAQDMFKRLDDSFNGVQESFKELLAALNPLFQDRRDAMQPTLDASSLANKLGGGAQGAPGARQGDGHPHANRDLQPAFDPNSMFSPAHDNVRPQQKPGAATPAPASPSVGAPDKVDSGTPVAASSRPGAVLPKPAGEVEVNKPIVVGPGEVFDGKNQLFRAGQGLDGGGPEKQEPMFIVAPGGTIRNVQFDGRNGGKLLGDGIHLMGDAKVDNVHAVHGGPDDMITIDGPGNRARDAYLAGIDASSIPSRPANVEITNSSFRHAHDKAIQLNGDANLKLKGIQAEDVGQLAVTMGGKPITANVSIEDATLNGVRSHVFRFDSRNSSVDIRNVETDNGRIQVMAGDPGKVSGATTVMASTDPA